MADIALSADHKILRGSTRFSILTGNLWRKQRVKIALLLFQGEWFRDALAGTDYKGSIVGKNTDLARRAELRRRVLSVPGVRDIDSMHISIDPKTRRTSVRIVAIAEDGEELAVSAEAGV